jgi:hypothetical protein
MLNHAGPLAHLINLISRMALSAIAIRKLSAITAVLAWGAK